MIVNEKKMKMLGRRFVVLTSLVGALSFSSFALSNSAVAADTVSLQEVLEDVTRTNPLILESMRNYQSVLAERSIAKSGYYPVVGTTISSGPERTDGVDTNDVEENLIATDASLYVRQNLFNGGETTAFVKETDARILAAAYDVLDTANNVYLDTAEAYINVVKTRELLAVAEQNALTQEKIMRQVREKTDAGFNRVSELYNSESRLALSKGSFISRQQDLNQALVVFHRRFGRLLGADQFVLPHPTLQLPPSLDETVELGLHTHPALKVAEYNIESSRFAFERSEAADYPTIDLELRGDYRDDTGGDEGDTTQMGAYLKLNYTFYDGGLRKGEQLRDRQLIRKENQRSYIERRNVNETIRLAWNVKEAEDYKRAYLSEHVELSVKTLDAFKEEYYVGRRTLLDLLNMENEYTDAKLSLSESEFSHLVSLYRLMQATGILLEEHNTGLRKNLNLPEEDFESIFAKIDRDKVEGYKDISDNRDADDFIDTVDQCDNSSALAPEFGCEDTDVNTTGYPHDDTPLAPYIVPNTFESSTSTEGNTQSSILQKNSVIRLSVRSDVNSLTTDAAAKLSEFTLAVFSQDYKGNILVDGYVASDNDTKDNIKLSLDRANMVKNLLVEDGIDESRIMVFGHGNKNPISDNGTKEGRNSNRRVEIRLAD